MLSFEEILKISADENKSCKYLQSLGVIKTYSKCPYCGAKNIGLIRRCYYRCYRCAHEWSPRRGSILEKTRIKYGKLLMLVKLYDLGASAYKASKELKISETTVSRIYRTLRKKKLRKVESIGEDRSRSESVSSDVTKIEITTETHTSTETTYDTIPTSDSTSQTASATETPTQTHTSTDTTYDTIPTSDSTPQTPSATETPTQTHTSTDTTYDTIPTSDSTSQTPSATETPTQTHTSTETTYDTIPTSDSTSQTPSTTETLCETININGKSSESEQ